MDRARPSKFGSLRRSFIPWSNVLERHFIAEAIASTMALTARLIARNVKINPIATSRTVLPSIGSPLSKPSDQPTQVVGLLNRLSDRYSSEVCEAAFVI